MLFLKYTKIAPNFQNSSCPDDRLYVYCSILWLSDCKTSVELAEYFNYGKLLSDISKCDRYDMSTIEEIQNSFIEDETAIYAKFYDLYLNLTWVRAMVNVIFVPALSSGVLGRRTGTPA